MHKKYEFRKKYMELYPGVEFGKKTLLFLKRSDRRTEYLERDLKRSRYVKDKAGKAVRDKNGQVIDLPAREVSMEQRYEEGWDFVSEFPTPEEIMIDIESADKHELRRCLTLLTDDERDLITAHYFENMTIRDYADSRGMSKSRVDRLHHKILAKLKNDFRQ